MVLDKNTGATQISHFTQLNNFLPPKSLLIFNEVKVTPARIFGYKPQSGGKIEALLLDIPEAAAPLGQYDLWCLVKPCSRLKIGADLIFTNENEGIKVQGCILEAGEQGRRKIRFHFDRPPHEALEAIGHMPLPPYIRRPDSQADAKRYQTVYAKTPGAVAAPTAGLHFTEEMLLNLAEAGQEKAVLTLKVGLGTFAPLTPEQLKSGHLHQEFMEITEETVQAINKAKAEKRTVVAVGTTAARALEWAAGSGQLKAQKGFGDLFIRPGYQWQVVEALITNFHLPQSSLLMMVAALAGRDSILQAYQRAISEKFKFFSYGDAMLIR